MIVEWLLLSLMFAIDQRFVGLVAVTSLFNTSVLAPDNDAAFNGQAQLARGEHCSNCCHTVILLQSLTLLLWRRIASLVVLSVPLNKNLLYG